jgi:hypothetical protein
VFPDAKERRTRYFKGMFGPVALAKTTLSAGLGTARNTPEEWGGQWEGFGKRVASNLGRRAIGNSVTYGLSEAFKLDSHYYASENKGFKHRVKNAFISQFTARKPNGKRVIGFPRIIGAYTSNVIAVSWYPSRYDYKDGLTGGTISLGMGVIYGLAEEFIFNR